MQCCRDFPRFLVYALYAATVAYRAVPSSGARFRRKQSSADGGEIGEDEREGKLGARVCVCERPCTPRGTTWPPRTVGVQESNRRRRHRSNAAKYSAARRGADVYRAVDRTFFLFFSLMTVDPRKFRELIQRLHHSILGENEIVSTVFECCFRGLEEKPHYPGKRITLKRIIEISLIYRCTTRQNLHRKQAVCWKS